MMTMKCLKVSYLKNCMTSHSKSLMTFDFGKRPLFNCRLKILIKCLVMSRTRNSSIICQNKCQAPRSRF
jgi:hypothetical protein